MPTLFFGCLTLALRVPFPADRGPADEQPELYCKHATRAVACRHIGPIVANPTMHFEGLGQLTPPPSIAQISRRAPHPWKNSNKQ